MISLPMTGHRQRAVRQLPMVLLVLVQLAIHAAPANARVHSSACVHTSMYVLHAVML